MKLAEVEDGDSCVKEVHRPAAESAICSGSQRFKKTDNNLTSNQINVYKFDKKLIKYLRLSRRLQG